MDHDPLLSEDSAPELPLKLSANDSTLSFSTDQSGEDEPVPLEEGSPTKVKRTK